MPNPSPAAAPGLPAAIPDTPLGRLTFVAEALGVPAPEGLPADLLDADGAPAQPVLAFCAAHGASLDFIYLGDVAILVRYTAKAAQSRADTPVMRLFREWEAIMERKKAGLTDQQIETLLDRQIEIEDRMMDTAAQSRSDWIMKVMAYSTLGESGLPDHKDRPDLWSEARAFVA